MLVILLVFCSFLAFFLWLFLFFLSFFLCKYLCLFFFLSRFIIIVRSLQKNILFLEWQPCHFLNCSVAVFVKIVFPNIYRRFSFCSRVNLRLIIRGLRSRARFKWDKTRQDWRTLPKLTVPWQYYCFLVPFLDKIWDVLHLKYTHDNVTHLLAMSVLQTQYILQLFISPDLVYILILSKEMYVHTGIWTQDLLVLSLVHYQLSCFTFTFCSLKQSHDIRYTWKSFETLIFMQ